jgi:RNA polymerase sigma-70 factor, ECF subfamily
MERSLVERVRQGIGRSSGDAGDRAAFDAVVRSRFETVYRTSLAILGNPADAADAAQETFAAAWRARSSVRDPDRFDAWLGRLTVNSCRQIMRRRRSRVREIPMPELSTAWDPPATERSIEDRTVSADTFDRAFARLGADDRAILVLHHLRERPVAEIAEALGCPQGTVKARLFRARAALEAALAKESR